MKTTRPLLIAFAAILTAQISAQTPTGTLPKALHHAWGAGLNTLDSSVKKFTLQNWYNGTNLPIGTVISAITLRGHPSYGAAAYTANLEVTIENTSLSFGRLSPKLANNISTNAIVVFARKPMSVPALPPAQHPNDARNHWIVLDRPFVFTGPNLIIQIDQEQRLTTGVQYYDDTTMMSSTLHSAVTHARCGALLRAQYVGGSYDLLITGAPPSQPLSFLFGFDNVAAGGLQFPLDLSQFGAPGCTLGFLPFASVSQLVDGSGNANMRLPFPLPANSLLISVQALHLNAANPNAIATTNTVNSVLGQTGSFQSIPSFDGINALPGFPMSINTSVILLVR